MREQVMCYATVNIRCLLVCLTDQECILHHNRFGNRPGAPAKMTLSQFSALNSSFTYDRRAIFSVPSFISYYVSALPNRTLKYATRL